MLRGFRSTLCGAHVPEDKLDAFIADVNALPGVTHNYLRNHVPRAFPENPLTADEARALVHTLEVESVRPVLIPRNGQEIFCYEIRGTYDGQTYLVYLDAVTGQTQDILQVVLTDDGEQVM